MYVIRRLLKRNRRQEQGQTLVEFMLILPVLMLVVLGVIEFGRLFAIYTGIASATREASRYGASVGDNGSGTPRYLDCAGIRDAARRVALFSVLADADIQITYDDGNPAATIATCDSGPDPNDIQLGDRVVVRIDTNYAPIVPIVPAPPMSLVSVTGRTILKEVAAGPTATLGGPGATATNSPTPLPTNTGTVTATFTPTASATATATVSGPSATPTATFTPSATATSFPTPTEIPAPQNFNASIPNCGTRKVNFNWSPVSGADHYRIYRLDPPPTSMIALDSNPPCNNCDTLPHAESSRTYYVVAVVNGRESPASNVSTISCPSGP